MKLTKLGEAIELAQRSRRMSDSDLAAAVGVSAQSVWRWKHKKKPGIHPVIFEKLVRVLGLKNVSQEAICGRP